MHSFRFYAICFESNRFEPGTRNINSVETEISYLDKALHEIVLYSFIQAVSIYINYFSLTLDSKNPVFANNVKELTSFLKDFSKTKIFDRNIKRKIIFEIYRNMYLAYFHKDKKEYYLTYKKSVEKNENFLGAELINIHYNSLINFCMMKDRMGEEKEYFKKEGLLLMLKYYKDNYFKVGETELVTKIEFTNFIVRAYSSREFGIMKSFIEEISSKLRSSDYNNMVNYGMAYYYLGMKDYRKALKSINNITDKTFIIKFDVRNIELRIYYELGKIETLIEAIHNYRTVILKNQELTENEKENLLKLLKYLNILIKINLKTDIREQIYESEFYKKKIEKEPIFSLKSWLLEKFENLIADINIRKNKKTNVVGR